MKQKCYKKNKECDKFHGLHQYSDYQGHTIISCMYHVPMGWKRKR